VHYLRADYRIMASAFYNRIDNLIDQIVDPGDGLLVFENLGGAVAKGLEFEAERLWNDGTRLRASYAWQLAEDEATGARLVNSPRHLAKLNLAAPLFGTAWRGGLELQYVGARKTLAGAEAKAYTLANVTVLNERLSRNLALSVSVYNLFDARHADPGGVELVHDDGAVLDTVSGDGRSFRLKATWQF
jgi:iron complex outermembrane receptor protein